MQARKCIRKGDLESLVKADELVNMLKTRRAFQVRDRFESQTIHCTTYTPVLESERSARRPGLVLALSAALWAQGRILVPQLQTEPTVPLQGWTEGHIKFPPTFKFKRGTNLYLGSTHDDPQEGPETPEKADAPVSALLQMPKSTSLPGLSRKG